MSIEKHPLLRDWLMWSNGRLVIKTGKVDIGQRISTALTRIVGGELGVRPDDIAVAPVTTGISPDEGITSGSNSIEQSGAALRTAASTMRRVLIGIAARRMEVPGDQLALRDGMVLDTGSNRSLDLGNLANLIDPETPVDPDAEPLPATEPLAPSAPRGITEMVRGTYSFIHDVERPNMLHGRVLRPPHANARLARIDEQAVGAAEAAGFRVVRDGSFLAVAGEDEYQVIKAARRLGAACEWDLNGGLSDADVFALLHKNARISRAVIDGTPSEAEIPPGLTDPDHRAVYERPYQMHGALAPSAAFAEFRDGRLEILSHSQGTYVLRSAVAESLGMDAEAVVITHVPSSGCYGHNGADDAAFEAALIARALPGTPVMLKWSRADEHGWEPLTSAMRVELSACVEDGRITAWSGEAFSDTHGGRPRSGPNQAGPARLLANRFRDNAVAPFVPQPAMGRHAGIHRNLDPLYNFPERRLVKHLVRHLPLRTSALRCLGGAANTFAIESFMDELADRAGAEPLAFRRDHLADTRGVAVLDALGLALGRMPQPDLGPVGRGFGFAQYKNAQARVGVMVDLAVTDAAEIRLLRAVIVADAGRIIDPDGLSSQLEGGFLQAASWTLCEEVKFDRDGIQSLDWESYPVLRFDNVPEIEVILLDLPAEKSLGAGEAACGPAMAAIANAVKMATGLRLRRVPFSARAIRESAIASAG